MSTPGNFSPYQPPKPTPQSSYSHQQVQNNDATHLTLLAIFYYVMSGFVFFGSLFPLIYVIMGIFFVAVPADAWDGDAPPEAIGIIFIIVGIVFSGIFVCLAASLVYVGRCLQKRKNHIFCLVVAGVICLSIPVGTALGIFTFIVLLRPSVKPMFGR